MKEKKRRKGLKIRHILVCIMVIYVGTTFINQQKLIVALNKEKIEKQNEIDRLNSEIKDIEEKLEYTDSLEYIEKMAREELKMVMPDEIIFIDKNRNKDKPIKGIDN
ncbi:Cell division protein FtsB [Proteiniborus ethanoligenes]|uniref:Cell division protein FtsB n=1 Tax=Proteiniborus ethanoligenes TaxID=415015 RepID=A0A1H3KYX1_9FIRM|nr:septum formation initiator family protein [Proteiniborus ethanoligenes]SDY57361.1 Cell division protein FtsB [Proteiniborus ethanoligenes]